MGFVSLLVGVSFYWLGHSARSSKLLCFVWTLGITVSAIHIPFFKGLGLLDK